MKWRKGRAPRVLIVVQNLPVPMDRRVWLESQALVAAGYDVSVICPKGPGDSAYEELDGVVIRRYSPAPSAHGVAGYAYEFLYCWIRTAMLTLKVLARGRIDVFQACNPPDTYFLLAALLKLLGTRFVFDHHDLCPELYQARMGRDTGPVLTGLRLLERLTFQTADHVISTNDSYREIALTRGSLDPASVTVVRSGPNLDRLRPGPPRPELKRGRDFLCCYLGIMGPQDGVATVVEAADIIVNEMGRTDCQFALLGFGDCLEALRLQARELDLEDWITFTGRADDAMICDYLSTAELGLSPDPKNPFNDRCTMNKTAEYMTFGVPVVSFDLHETMVTAGPAAVCIQSGDAVAFAKAILALLDDPSKRMTMGAAGADLVRQHLAWQHQAPVYVGIYRGLVNPERAIAAKASGQFLPVPMRPVAAMLAVLGRVVGIDLGRTGPARDF